MNTEYLRKIVIEYTVKMMDYMKNDKSVKNLSFDNVSIDVFPNVFSALIFKSSSIAFSKSLSSIIGNKPFMEIGVGTGVLTTYICKQNKNDQVAVVDINEDALRNAKHNFIKNGLNLNNISVYHSDVYNNIDPNKKFDYIFWNYPYYFSRPPEKDEPIIYRAAFDYGGVATKRFIQEAPNYLNENGRILLLTATIEKDGARGSVYSDLEVLVNSLGKKLSIVDVIDLTPDLHIDNFSAVIVEVI